MVPRMMLQASIKAHTRSGERPRSREVDRPARPSLPRNAPSPQAKRLLRCTHTQQRAPLRYPCGCLKALLRHLTMPKAVGRARADGCCPVWSLERPRSMMAGVVRRHDWLMRCGGLNATGQRPDVGPASSAQQACRVWKTY
ncbi:hypothetical protein GY45DRAFT_119794 [Cubamyces sp. BRFM 1775]|nr:hypothetical protein GY45DRAFT_119794 [Cubamyces sp. BRFM 1775]